MQKFFFGDIVIPLISFLKDESFVNVSPTREYDACFHVVTISLLGISYEKHPGADGPDGPNQNGPNYAAYM